MLFMEVGRDGGNQRKAVCVMCGCEWCEFVQGLGGEQPRCWALRHFGRRLPDSACLHLPACCLPACARRHACMYLQVAERCKLGARMSDENSFISEDLPRANTVPWAVLSLGGKHTA